MNRPPCFHGNSLLPDQPQTRCLNMYTDMQRGRHTDRQTVWELVFRVSIHWVCFHISTLLHFASSELGNLWFTLHGWAAGNTGAHGKEEEGVFATFTAFLSTGRSRARWHLSSAPIYFTSEFKNNNNKTEKRRRRRRWWRKRRRRRREASRVLVSILECTAWVGVFAVRQW